MDLTPGMREALLQVGFGVTGRKGGFFDEDNERVDLRSAQALANRGLIYYFATGGAPMVGRLRLTDLGEALFEEVRFT